MKQKAWALISSQVSEAIFELRNAVYQYIINQTHYVETKASI